MDSTKFEFISSQKGLNPTPTEAQKQALNKLNQQLQVKLKLVNPRKMSGKRWSQKSSLI